MSKTKTAMLLATSAVVVTSFGSAAAAQAGTSTPQQHPEIIGVLKHPDRQLEKHPDGRVGRSMACRVCNLNGPGIYE